MAEEQTTEQETAKQESPKPPEHKPEDRREERREEPAKDEKPNLVKCPECRVQLDPSDLGSHRYLSHQVERRAKPKRDGDGDDGDDEKRNPRTPTRRSSSQSGEKGGQSDGKKKSRWSDTRASWGG